MATITKKHVRTRQFGSAPYGNLSVLRFQLATIANGSLFPSDVATAIQIADVVDLGELPAGMSLDDMLMRVSVAPTATVTASLGFKYTDGVDNAQFPQDAAYFGAGITVATAGCYRMATTKSPVILPKNARLILTWAVAANAKASQIDIQIYGEIGRP